jgi:hypothetical protein
MRRPGIIELEYCRSVLLREVKDLGPEQLDFLVFSNSKSIGEMLLHIAAFEFLMISVSAFQRSSKSYRRILVMSEVRRQRLELAI